jgi:hypothetical protein
MCHPMQLKLPINVSKLDLVVYLHTHKVFVFHLYIGEGHYTKERSLSLFCGGMVVKALRYKPKGRGFDSQWCHWNFLVT